MTRDNNSGTNPNPDPNPEPGVDTTKPTVKIERPANGSQISWGKQIYVTATDNVKVTWMELYIEGKRVATSGNQNSLSYNWVPLTNPPSGNERNITAKSFDAAGNWAETSIIVYR